jgi:hypothetical protein
MSAYIYLYNERIIYWMPQTPLSQPAAVPEIKWYSVMGNIPMPFNDMVLRENVSYNLQKGFFTIDNELPPDWDQRGDLIKKIHVISSFNSLANTQKLRFTDSGIGQSLHDVLLLDEIREFRKHSDISECTILSSLLANTEEKLTPEGLVTKLWLQFESFRAVIAHLNKLEFSVRKLLKENQFDKAQQLVNSEFEKVRM